MALIALTTEVTARYSTQKLVEFTNPDVPWAVAIDAGRLAAACADAAGDFLRIVGVAYDTDDTHAVHAAHVGPAVHRAFARLAEYMDPAGAFAADLLSKSEAELDDLRGRVGMGARFVPVTDSVLSPSFPDTSSGFPVRPDFDTSRFSDYLPGIAPRDPNQ